MFPARSPPRAESPPPPIRLIPLSVFLERPWRALKSADFQSLKTEAETKKSHHRVSERVTDWESEWDWESHPPKTGLWVGEEEKKTLTDCG